MSKVDLFKRYIGPVVICALTVWLGFRIQYWYDGLYNDRMALRSIVQLINSGAIEVKKK